MQESRDLPFKIETKLEFPYYDATTKAKVIDDSFKLIKIYFMAHYYIRIKTKLHLLF